MNYNMIDQTVRVRRESVLSIFSLHVAYLKVEKSVTLDVLGNLANGEL